MTHFTVGIIIPNSVHHSELDAYLVEAMAPYNEGKRVKAYVSYSPEQARLDLARDIAKFERIIEREDTDYKLEKCRQTLAELKSTTFETRYAEYVAHHRQFNKRGQPISTNNPDSKWDWWVIGGRWDGWINDRETDQQSIADNSAPTSHVLLRDRTTHALITPDGVWHEQGRMGWWGILLTEDEDWETKARSILAKHPDCYVLILDAHI